MFAFAENGVATNFAPSLSYILTKNLVGNLEYGMGLNPYMKTTLEYQYETIKLSLICQLSAVNPFASCTLSKSFQNDQLVLQSTLRYGYMGIFVQYGVMKKVSEFLFLHANIIVSSMSGVFLSLK